GRYANNGWLQELPKPLTRLTWDNAALFSPAAAARLGLADGDVVELSYRGRTLRVAAMILPGQADGSVTLHLGYGRARSGRVGTGPGFNAYALRTSDAPWFGAGVSVRAIGERHALATTQHQQNMVNRDLVRVATVG